MNWHRPTPALTLFLAAGLSSCATVGVPHIGAVDTRLQPAGTTKVEVSAGPGVALPNQGPSGGAMVSVDAYATSKTSIAVQAQGMLVPRHNGTNVVPGLRFGMRYRPSARLSLGFGAKTGADFGIGIEHARYQAGGDVELATSSSLGKRHFSSHAWRLGVDVTFKRSINYRALGDWTLSVPTRNPNLRFSYGLSYGFAYFDRSIQPQSPNKKQPNKKIIDHVNYPDYSLLVGVHVGLLWGRH